jgi:hypothetical protein
MNSWMMLSLVLLSIVGMDSMSHICGYEKAFSYRSLNILICGNFTYALNNSLSGYIYKIAVGSLSRT